MLTSKTKRIFSDNVTCFGTNKCCSNRSHLQDCFNCSLGLACKGTVPNSLSPVNFEASLYLCPADCFQEILFEQARPLTGTSRNFSDISSDISARWAHESTSLDVNNANGMLTSHAKRIFSDNVTCFGTNKSCSNRSHLPDCFIKALCFLLA